MATCPECEFDEIDVTDFEEGDLLSCPECGNDLVVSPTGDLAVADDEDDDLDDDDDEDDVEEVDDGLDEDDEDDVEDEDE